jgi:hypothetical protein
MCRDGAHNARKRRCSQLACLRRMTVTVTLLSLCSALMASYGVVLLVSPHDQTGPEASRAGGSPLPAPLLDTTLLPPQDARRNCARLLLAVRRCKPKNALYGNVAGRVRSAPTAGEQARSVCACRRHKTMTLVHSGEVPQDHADQSDTRPAQACSSRASSLRSCADRCASFPFRHL